MREHTYFVYIVRCSDASLYTGVTNDYQRRIAEHNAGVHLKAYTFRRRPVTLVYIAEFQYIYDAIAWEKRLKRWGRQKKEALIRGDSDALARLSKKDFVKYHERHSSLRPPRADYSE